MKKFSMAHSWMAAMMIFCMAFSMCAFPTFLSAENYYVDDYYPGEGFGPGDYYPPPSPCCDSTYLKAGALVLGGVVGAIWGTNASHTGSRGKHGERGEKGDQGGHGQDGQRGPPGPSGPPGANNSVTGPTGPTGPTGSGATGPQGAPGATGPVFAFAPGRIEFTFTPAALVAPNPATDLAAFVTDPGQNQFTRATSLGGGAVTIVFDQPGITADGVPQEGHYTFGFQVQDIATPGSFTVAQSLGTIQVEIFDDSNTLIFDQIYDVPIQLWESSDVADFGLIYSPSQNIPTDTP